MNMNQTFKQAKVFSDWSSQKGKEAWEKFHPWANDTYEKARKRAAARSRLGRIKRSKAAKERQERAEYQAAFEERQRQDRERADYEKRKALFTKRTELLSDEYNMLTHDLTAFAKGRPRSEKRAIINQHTTKTPSCAGPNLAMNLVSIAVNAGDHMRNGYVTSTILAGGGYQASRAVSDLSDKEIGILRVLALLHFTCWIGDDYYDHMERIIIFNHGQCVFQKVNRSDALSTNELVAKNAIFSWMQQILGHPQSAIQDAVGEVSRIRQECNDPDLVSKIDEILVGTCRWQGLAS